MSVKTMNELAQLFKDGKATTAERATLLAAFRRDQELNVMSIKARATLDELRKRATANRAAS